MKIDERQIDAAGINPGDVLDMEECERLIGIRRSDDPIGYQLGLLQLNAAVVKLLRRLGRRYTVTCDEGRINVLTHREASIYNARRFDAAASAMRRANKRLIAVDVSELDQSERESHDRAIVKQSRVLLGMKLTRGEPIVMSSVNSNERPNPVHFSRPRE